jgi:alpha-tubulin suppressor-like RCC1 family protein
MMTLLVGVAARSLARVLSLLVVGLLVVGVSLLSVAFAQPPFGGVQAVAGGASYSLALRSDGTVWAWGDNDYGQLGNGTTSYPVTYSPAQVRGLTNVRAIAAGGYHALALRSDGTVWAWGSNNHGELGDGTTMDRSTTVQVTGLANVQAIAAGAGHSLALRSDGTVWAWGSNEFGELGDGTTTNRSTPVQVSGLLSVQAIAAGFDHSLALRSDGTVWAWGSNNYGELGNDSTSNRGTPVQVSGLQSVQAIAAGSTHSLALRSDGTVWAWGANWSGKLGDGTTTDRGTPVRVLGLSDVQAIKAGGRHSLGLGSNGTVWEWGVDLGLGAMYEDETMTGDRVTPVQVEGLTNVQAITTGSYFSLALRSDGTIWAWGVNDYGQLGDDAFGRRSIPEQVRGISGSQSDPQSSLACSQLTDAQARWLRVLGAPQFNGAVQSVTKTTRELDASGRAGAINESHVWRFDQCGRPTQDTQSMQISNQTLVIERTWNYSAGGWINRIDIQLNGQSRTQTIEASEQTLTLAERGSSPTLSATYRVEGNGSRVAATLTSRNSAGATLDTSQIYEFARDNRSYVVTTYMNRNQVSRSQHNELNLRTLEVGFGNTRYETIASDSRGNPTQVRGFTGNSSRASFETEYVYAYW